MIVRFSACNLVWLWLLFYYCYLKTFLIYGLQSCHEQIAVQANKSRPIKTFYTTPFPQVSKSRYLKYLKRGCKDDSQTVLTDSEMGTNWNIRGFMWTSVKTLLYGSLSTGRGYLGSSGVSLLGDFQKLLGYGPGQHAVYVPAWAGWLGQRTSRSPLQSQSFCGFVILWKFSLVQILP